MLPCHIFTWEVMIKVLVAGSNFVMGFSRDIWFSMKKLGVSLPIS